MIPWARPLLLFETLLFWAASLVHAGVLLSGYEHARAATAEGVIGAVLLLGFVASLVWPASMRRIALAVQSFAILGTLVGAFTIAIGVGPQSNADYVFHVFLLVVLVSGLVALLRARAS